MASSSGHDPYSDYILTRLLTVRESADLTSAEREVLTAAVRSEILYDEQIRDILAQRARGVYAELRSIRVNLPTTDAALSARAARQPMLGDSRR